MLNSNVRHLRDTDYCNSLDPNEWKKDEAFNKIDKGFLLTLGYTYFSSLKTNEVEANQVERICFLLFDCNEEPRTVMLEL